MEQQKLDFTGRSNALASLKLPTPPADWRTSVSTMKHALKTINQMIGTKDGFRVRIKVLAERMSASESTTKRALRGLKELGLVEHNRTGRGSVYSIRWEGVQNLSAKGHSDLSDRSLCAIRKVNMTYQIGHNDLSQNENSCANSCDETELGGGGEEATFPFTDPFTAAPTADDWAAAEEAFAAEGVQLAGRLVMEAQQLEFSVAECLAIVAEFRLNRALFQSPGAIAWRLRNGDWPVDGIVTPELLAEAERRKAAEIEQRRREDRERRESADEWRQEVRALEAAYGDELDSLDEESAMSFARLVLNEFEFARWRSGRAGMFERHALLCAIHEQRNPRAPPQPR